jgi:alkanesulfonate monooxygenase SsuD/methylene tetrahydromethanopterin reductase-like flavin-dependent oxidoreductase (luciferase family)
MNVVDPIGHGLTSGRLSYNAAVRLGLALPNAMRDGAPLTGPALIAGARAVERAGFDSLWCFDSIGRGFMIPDPLIAVSVAATATERLELGTGILQVPLRRPVELAHRVLAAHLVCGDRLLLGVGAGSTKADFDAVGVDFESRMRQFDEALAVMRRLWQGEKVGAAQLHPWPATLGGPKLLIGSWAGSRWIPRAAKDFDGWIGSGARSSVAALREGIKLFRDAGGRRAIATNIPVDLDAPTAPLPDEGQFHLRCDAKTAAERLATLAELGFDDAVLVTRRYGDGDLAALRALIR